MCEEKYKFYNRLIDLFYKLLNSVVYPVFGWIYKFFIIKKTEKEKIQEMVQFIKIVATDKNKLKQLDDIMNMPDFGSNLRKRLTQSQEDANKIFFVRFMGMKPNIERWLSEEWDFIHMTYYIAIHPLFFKAYQNWQKGLKNRKKHETKV